MATKFKKILSVQEANAILKDLEEQKEFDVNESKKEIDESSRAITKKHADIMRKVLQEKRKFSNETYEDRMKERLRGFKNFKP